MYSQDLIEELIQHELKGLCTNCALESDCTYRKASHKIIIQCELYQFSDGSDMLQSNSNLMQKGLCVNCSSVNSCGLPGKHTGIWHCEEYA